MTPDEQKLRDWVTWIDTHQHEHCSWDRSGASDGQCDCWVKYAVQSMRDAADEQDVLQEQVQRAREAVAQAQDGMLDRAEHLDRQINAIENELGVYGTPVDILTAIAELRQRAEAAEAEVERLRAEGNVCSWSDCMAPATRCNRHDP